MIKPLRLRVTAIVPSTLLNVTPLEWTANVMTPNTTPTQNALMNIELIFGVLAAARPTTGCHCRRRRCSDVGRICNFCGLIVFHRLQRV
jgi:hypothetical protein